MKSDCTPSFLLLRVFKSYIFPHKISVVCTLFSMFISAYCVTRLIKGVEPLVNSIFAIEPKFADTFFMCFMLLGVSLVRGIAEFGQNFFIKYIGYRVICSMQLDLFRSFIKSSAGYIKGQPLGHVIAKLTNDVFLTRSLFIVFFSGCLRHVCLMLFITVELLAMDFAVTLVALCILPLVGYLVSLLSKRLRAIVHEVQHEFANYTSRITQIFSAIIVVKSSSAMTQEEELTKAQLSKVQSLYKSKLIYNSATLTLVECINGLTICGLLLYWTFAASGGNVQGGPGRLTALLMAFSALYRPFKGMMSLNGPLQEGLAAVARVFKALDESSENTKEYYSGIGLKNPYKITLREHFEGAELKLGEITAICGPEGSGKTATIMTIAGYQTSEQLLISSDSGDCAISQISEASLIKNIGLLPQESFLFSRSIFENIAYGQCCTFEEVTKAAKAIGVNDFICALPQGYNTIAFDMPKKEKRLICIARLLVKDPSIMLLDEPTCDLDADSIERLFHLLVQVKGRKIIVMTSKSIELAQSIADKILTLC